MSEQPSTSDEVVCIEECEAECSTSTEPTISGSTSSTIKEIKKKLRKSEAKYNSNNLMLKEANAKKKMSMMNWVYFSQKLKQKRKEVSVLKKILPEKLVKFQCPICFEEYGDGPLCPRVLTLCGHTFCTACINRMIGVNCEFKCPYNCNVNFAVRAEDFPVNMVIKERSLV